MSFGIGNNQQFFYPSFCGGFGSFQGAQQDENLLALELTLEKVSDKQGIFGKAWNSVKELTNLGVSEESCEKMLEKYQQGEVSFDEAVEYIEKFDTKQQATTELATNILTGVAAIATSVLILKGKKLPASVNWNNAIKYGAPIGALTKTSLGILDRSTNDVKGDALDSKKVAKDVVSGALTGTTSAVTSGVGAGIKTSDLGLTVKNGVKCGLECGALSGAVSYSANSLIDGTDFELDELVAQTVTSSLVSGSVGALVGAGLYGAAGVNGTLGQATIKSTEQQIKSDSLASSLRKFFASHIKRIFA